LPKFHLYSRLRELIRKARINSHWLSELEDTKIGLDVQKNITIFMNRKQQKRGVLTIHDKRLMKKPGIELTASEKAHLKELFSELACFSKLPLVRKGIS
jgi:hypothetical protein